MEGAAKFTARISRDGDWFVAFSPEFPEGNGQGLSEEEAMESLRQSILLLSEDALGKSGEDFANGEYESAWDHLSKFTGTVGDDFLVPERDQKHREIPDLE